VKNKNITEITTRGKAMVIRFKNDWLMHSHNQLDGRWTVDLAEKLQHIRQLRFNYQLKALSKKIT
tara:strand:- start:99 stop:293 length:195 start_codon:yes stop_codon:yes gene_type:complete